MTVEYRVREKDRFGVKIARNFASGHFTTTFTSRDQAEWAIAQALMRYENRKARGDKYVGERPEYIIQSREVSDWE